MIHIYWTDTTNIQAVSLEMVKNNLSVVDLKKYNNLVQPTDRKNFLCGRMLVQRFLQNEMDGKFHIGNIAINENKRPVISSRFTFSISHSQDFVAVGFLMGEGGMLGVDIEEILPIEIEDFLLPFSREEIMYLKGLGLDKYTPFYHLWTRKESLFKALGTGFLSDPSTIAVLQNHVSCCGKEFFFQELQIHPRLVVTICTDRLSGFKIVTI